jgi:uncharacterized membrane protein
MPTSAQKYEFLICFLASVTIPMVIAYGKLLDMSRWSQPKRAWISFALWAILQAACFIWIGIEYSKFGTATASLDYKEYALPEPLLTDANVISKAN